MMSQFIKFIGVGGINTIVTYLFYLILLQLFSYQVSYTITYVFGIGLSYWLNLKFVFRENGSRKKIVLFPLVYFTQYLIGMIIIYFAIETYSVSEVIAPVLVILITLPLTFFLSKLILTTKEKHHEI